MPLNPGSRLLLTGEAVCDSELMPWVRDTLTAVESFHAPCQTGVRPRGPFPQVYLPPLETLKPLRAHSDAAPQFWIRYDAQKVVGDFGCGALPGTD